MYNYINDDVKIDFTVSSSINNLIEMCEKYDKENNYGAYENYASVLTDVVSKEAYIVGNITKKQWETIQRRFLL